MSELAAIQRRIAALVRAPEGVEARLRHEGEAARAEIESRIRGDHRAGAAQRLEIYAHAYFHRIEGVLARDYPALRTLLGPAGFHDLVAVYLMAHPSRHPSLRQAGAALPGFLASGPAGEPFRRRWPFAGDLARLEWALVEAFDASDLPLLAREALVGLRPEAFADLVLRPAPGVALLDLGWRVAAARSAVDREEPPPAPERGREAILVRRWGEVPRHEPVDRIEAEALRAVLAGVRFDALCARVAALVGEDEAPARAAGLLAWMLDRGLLAGPA